MSKNKTRNPFESVIRNSRTDARTVIGIPILLLFLGIFTRWVCGSPLDTLHYVGARPLVPQTWIMVLLFSASYIVAGLSLGLALGCRFCPCGEKKYQGAMWFCISLALGYSWYPLFFCARLFLVSIIVSALCFFASICATVCFASVSKSSFFLALAYDAWLMYLLFLNLQIFFAI
ncbi:MAG: tryptophan-rich sensory protein [Clostridia bacterium]|nr:tryptophan-rich sensory protein [Clostridia bacterium]